MRKRLKMKVSGNFPETFPASKISGKFPETFRKVSGNFPEIFDAGKVSGKFPETFIFSLFLIAKLFKLLFCNSLRTMLSVHAGFRFNNWWMQHVDRLTDMTRFC